MKKTGDDMYYRDLAEKLYSLDTEVYETSGSELGKVFPGMRSISEKQIRKDMQKGDTDKIWDELTLIGNMIHIMEEGERKEAFQARYAELEQELDKLFGTEGALRSQISADFTDDRFGLHYKGEDQHIVICIARQCGAGGHEIGYRLAKRLGIAFYDRKLIDMLIDEKDEKFLGINGRDAYYIRESRVIEEIARAGDCVIVGRTSGHVTMVHNIPRLSVFIGAPLENRIRRKILITNKNRKEVLDLIKVTDKKRKTTYNYYTGKKWGSPADFDVCLNSACYGIEGTVDLLEQLVQLSLDGFLKERNETR